MKTSNRLAWMLFVSRRFARVDRQGRSALTSYLSALGIAFGVMTLIVVMAVMNGFQLGYIESILEISSYHIRANVVDAKTGQSFYNVASENEKIRLVSPFYEEQALVVGRNSRQQAAMLRFVQGDIMQHDKEFASQLTLIAGTFDVGKNKTVIGSTLARTLGVRIGDTIDILAMSGSSEVDLFSESRIYEVSGIFASDYAEINSTFMFFSLETAQEVLGEFSIPQYGIKLYNAESDYVALAELHEIATEQNIENDIRFESWRSYNRAFFGALRVEKILLMLLVFMIFIVVGVNIFNSMRRMVFERREEIAVLTALGSTSLNIQSIFILRGLIIGLTGALSGLILGVFVSLNMDVVFVGISKIVYYFQYAFVMIVNSENAYLVTENPMFSFYARIPTRMDVVETTLITLFGLFSALSASWVASRRILKLFAAEVLRYE